MSTVQRSPPAPDPSISMKPQCRHPRVQIVAREEDSEFVECLECGDIFEASEFKDMAIEERTPANEACAPPLPVILLWPRRGRGPFGHPRYPTLVTNVTS